MTNTKRAKASAERGKTATSYATPALDKGLDVLELLAKERGGLMKSEIARALGRTISEIFRMLLCLERRGYILQVADERYVLSLKMFHLAQMHPPTEYLLNEALPHMHTIAAETNHCCHMGVLEGDKVVILAQVNSPSSMGYFVRAGTQVDLMDAATGQVILAYLPQESRERVLAQWRHNAGRRIPAGLTARLNSIRRRGHEVRASYQVRGVENVSYPILDLHGKAVAAITVPYFELLKGGTPVAKVEEALEKATHAISMAIGARQTI